MYTETEKQIDKEDRHRVRVGKAIRKGVARAPVVEMEGKQGRGGGIGDGGQTKMGKAESED